MTAIFMWFTQTRIGREVGIAILALIVIGCVWRWSTNRAFTNGKLVGGQQMGESIRKAKEAEWKAKEEEFAKRELGLQQASKELEQREALSNTQLTALRLGLKKDVAGLKDDLTKIPLIVANVPTTELIPQLKVMLTKLGPPQLQ